MIESLQPISRPSLSDEIVGQIYLATLSRRPTPAELEAGRTFLTQSPTPQECYQDLLWALINSKQFMFVR